MYVTTQHKLSLHEQTQIVANVACIVVSQQFLSQIANLLVSLFLLWSYFLFKILNFINFIFSF